MYNTNINNSPAYLCKTLIFHHDIIPLSHHLVGVGWSHSFIMACDRAVYLTSSHGGCLGGYSNDEQYICNYFGIENYSYETHCKNRHSLIPNWITLCSATVCLMNKSQHCYSWCLSQKVANQLNSFGMSLFTCKYL